MRHTVTPKNPPLPVYDRAKDGNVFDWIVRRAKEVRRERLELGGRKSER